jgi:hypothetical protein
MHNGYARQVEHVRLCAKKKRKKEHKVTWGELNPSSLQKSTHYIVLQNAH